MKNFDLVAIFFFIKKLNWFSSFKSTYTFLSGVFVVEKSKEANFKIIKNMDDFIPV